MCQPSALRRWAGRLAVAVVLGWSARAYGQEPREQDKLDLRGGANLVVGAGARALGMGGAFLARADDATAASWNPAGLSYLRRPEVSVVGRLSESRIVAGAEGGDRRDIDLVSGLNPDFASAAYPVSLGAAPGAVQLSFQRVIPFSGNRMIQRPSRFLRLTPHGGFDVLALGCGLMVFERVRVGATVNRWTNGLEQSLVRHFIRSTDPNRFDLDSEQELDFRLSGWNVNAGIIWSPTETLNLGAVVKTPFTGKVLLRRARTDYGGDPPSEETITENAFESNAVRVKFPASLGAGFSWRPSSPLTVSVDYTWTNWSRARILNFFTLPPTPRGRQLQPPRPALGEDLFESLSYPDLALAVNQTNADTYRIGVEYVLVRERLKVPFRVGYFNDRQYFKPIGANDSPRFNGFTAGAGLVLGPLLLDLAYVVETGSYRDVFQPEDGPHSASRQSVTLHRAFVSIIYRYGGNR